jgi:hypothetical protein
MYETDSRMPAWYVIPIFSFSVGLNGIMRNTDITTRKNIKGRSVRMFGNMVLRQ